MILQLVNIKFSISNDLIINIVDAHGVEEVIFIEKMGQRLFIMTTLSVGVYVEYVLIVTF